MIFITTPSTVESQQGPLKHARIGYHNPSGTIVASTEATDFPAAAANNDDTFEFWKPTAVPATWRKDFGAAIDVNYCGIAAHNLAKVGASLQVQYSTNDSTWNNASDVHTPTDDSDILCLFPFQNARYWRVNITTAIPTIAHIRFGSVLTMQRGLYRGHSPITLSRETVIRPAISEGGQWLGRSILRGGFIGSAEWRNLTATWYRANFDPFVKEARSHPFFFAWRPYEFLSEIAYVWVNDDITPVNAGPRDFMSVGFQMRGTGGQQ